MPLHAPEPPAAGEALMRTTIRDLAQQRVFRTPAVRAARPADLDVTEPHEVFVLGLDDLRAAHPAESSDGLTAARAVGWRYLVRSGDDVIAAAESVNGPGGAPQAFSQVNEGPFVAATADALRAMRIEPRVATHPFAQRLLHVPALHAMMLWLHHDGADDMLVPLAPFPLDVPTGQAVPAAELLARLGEFALGVEVEPADGTKGG